MTNGIATVVFVSAFLCLTSQSAWAQDVPRVEVGPLFTLIRSGSGTEAGVGGRLTVNINDNVGLDMEASLYPGLGDDVGGINIDAKLVTGLIGLKLTGLRSDSAALFVKIRPGFGRIDVDATIPPELRDQVGDLSGTSTEFALDYGGGFEWFLSQRIGFRFDAGDLYIRNSGHEFLFTAGVTFRF